MSDQQGNSSEKSESKDIKKMSLKELRQEAKSKGLEPDGNKSRADTWRDALINLEKEEKEKESKISSEQKEEKSQNGSKPISDKKEVKSEDLDSPQSSEDNSEDLDSPESSEDKESDTLPSAAAQEDIFDSVINRLEQRGVNIDSLSVRFDGEEALSYKNGDVDRNKITDKQSALLQSALNDPQNFEGTVTIKSGNKTLLKIENGQVTRDVHGLTSKSATLETESPYKKYAGASKKDGLEKTKEILGKAIDAGSTPDKAKDMIRESDPAYQKLEKRDSREAADKTLDKLSNEIIAKNQMKENQNQLDQKQERELEKAR